MSLDHEFETEKEGRPSSASASASKNPKHHSISATKLSDNSVEQYDLISDATLAKSNIVPILVAPPVDNYGSLAASSLNAQRLTSDEINYQIKLLSAPQSRAVLRSGSDEVDPMRVEMITIVLMILSVVIIAILLHLIINSVEKNSEPDDLVVYKITARSVNRDPLLAQHRYMPVSF
jgi:hypothetical protein